jgi:tellurite resistance protein
MPNRNTRDRRGTTPTEILAAYLDDRNDELLDAVVTAAALVARADGRIEPVERGLLVDFMDRNGFLSVFTRAEILDAFERRLRQFDERGGTEAAIGSLGRFAGRSPARFVVGASEHVAAASGRLQAGELRVLRFIRRVALGAPRAPSAPNRHHMRGAI